jgi:IS30 family transposase
VDGAATGQNRLLEQWSPEQISGHAVISLEKVYQQVYANKRASGLLCKNLRSQGLRKNRYGKVERRGTIPSRASIDDLATETTPKEGAHDHFRQRQGIRRAQRDRQQVEG